MLVDILLGIAGAIIGGWVVGFLGLHHNGRFVSSVLTEIPGSVILISLLSSCTEAAAKQSGRRRRVVF